MIGNDINANGILDEDFIKEFVMEKKVFHDGQSGETGLMSLLNTEIIPFGNATCPYGGLRIATGIDGDQNNTLEAMKKLPIMFVMVKLAINLVIRLWSSNISLLHCFVIMELLSSLELMMVRD